jgi:signal transduction histidine kinase
MMPSPEGLQGPTVPKRTGTPFVLRLLAAGVAFAFIATVGYAVLKFTAGYREAKTAVTNGVPSTEELVGARTELRHLNTAMDQAMLAKMQGQPYDRDGLDALRLAVEQHLQAYRALPSYPEEEDGRAKLDAAIGAVDQAKTSMESLLDTGSLSDADQFENADWRIATDEADDALHGLMLINMSHVHDHANQILSIGSRSIVVVTVGGLLSMLTAVIAIIIASRSVRSRELALEEKAREWELFSGRMAHDIMSPLQTVSLAVDAARDHGDAQLATAADQGRRALRRLTSTVHALLEFARSGGKPTAGQHASAAEVVAATVDELEGEAAEGRIALTAEPVPPVQVGCSASGLNIMLANLVRNAIKFMGDLPVREVRVVTRVTGGTVRFEVHDTGTGVAAELQAHLFEPYVRGANAPKGGIGLGLATVKRLAEGHGGRVGLRSREGQGSVFWIELPVV